MIDREKMREAVKAAIIEASPMDAREGFKFAGIFADAAIDAMLGVLPEPPLRIIKGASICTFSADGLYAELLKMRK